MEHRLGIVADRSPKSLTGVEWRLVAGKAEQFGHKLSGPLDVPDLHQYISASSFPLQDRDIIPAVRKLQTDEVMRHLKKKSSLRRSSGRPDSA